MADLAADSLLIPQLSDDLSVQCIARVPRSSHPALALVSRSWRSLLRSRCLYAARSQLGATEPSLCISIDDESGESRWFFLNLRPCRLLPLPLPLPSFPTRGFACAVLGPCLYLIGGNGNWGEPSSAVQIFDPRLNVWTTGPPIAQARTLAAASTLRTRIYIFGGCIPLPEDDGDVARSRVWAEVLDPASGARAFLPRQPTHLRNMFVQRSGVLGGQILLDNGLVFDPEAAQPWGTMSEALWIGRAVQTADIDGVLYTYNLMGELGGYDLAARVWRPVEGLEGELPHYVHYARLTNLRGLLFLVWIQKRITTEVHCVGVEINRTRWGGFRGSVAWRGVVGMPISHGSVRHSVVLEF